MDVTTAVNEPAIVGLVENVTVNEVEVAAVTVPTAPLLNETELLAVVGLKAVPAIVIVEASAAKLEVLLVTTGRTAAICTAVPLLTPPVVTTAVRLPATVGLVPKVTVNVVAVAPVTVPTAPLFITTTLLPGVAASKPDPLMVTVAALAAIAAELLVTTGVTVATCTAEPLGTLFVVTTAVKLPAVAGLVEKVTVRVVAVALVTVPTALLLSATVLLPGVVLKPKPCIVTVAALAAIATVRFVTTGVTVATLTAEPLLTELVET